MNVMIHCYPARMWYVDNFLIPSLRERIDGLNLIVWEDKDLKGNLLPFVSSAKYIKENLSADDGIWHLQDDVLLSEHFFSVASQAPKNMICNGVSIMDEHLHKFIGIQPIKNRWLSFPCIYIPNKLMSEFYDWFFLRAIVEGKYADKVRKKKYDDFLFWQFMKEKHKDALCVNLYPNIAQHVDYLIGGTSINQHHKPVNRSFYWLDKGAEDKLRMEIKKWQDQKLK